MNLDHLETARDVAVSAETIEQIESAANELDRIDESLYELDKRTRALKIRKDYITKTLIPRLMGAVSELTTESGLKIKTKRYLYVKVTDKDRLMAYLQATGNSHLIDTTIKVKKLASAAAEAIKQSVLDLGGVVAKIDQSMHHSSQRSFFNKLLTQNPNEQSRVEQFGEVKDYYDTKITRNP